MLELVVSALRPDWHALAACRGHSDLMFDPERVSEAKTLCRGCEARMPCLAWALEHDEPEGVWGMRTPEERTKVMRKSSVRQRPAMSV